MGRREGLGHSGQKVSAVMSLLSRAWLPIFCAILVNQCVPQFPHPHMWAVTISDSLAGQDNSTGGAYIWAWLHY